MLIAYSEPLDKQMSAISELQTDLPSMSLEKGSGQVDGMGRVNLLTATP